MPVNVPAACALMLNYPARVAANIFFFCIFAKLSPNY